MILEREKDEKGGEEGERDRNIDWLPFVLTLLEMEPVTFWYME